jgi:two-component system osmolarity sensor histidine kinase EnvZ
MRFLLIITVPTVIGQLAAVYIFYDRHWYNVSHYTSSLITNEISAIAKNWEAGDVTSASMLSKHLKIKYEFYAGKKISKKQYKNWAALEIFQNMLTTQLRQKTHVELSKDEDKVIIELQFKDGLMRMQFASKPLMNPTTYIFVLWILGLTVLLLTVSLVFSKNQIRSVLELARAADEFGRGVKSPEAYKPSGASEIRKAGLAFIRMRERIERQIAKRTQLLAMISHDLRTPLTRIKLQLELMDNQDEATEMAIDVQSMEQMITSYLDFARGEGGEAFQKVDIQKWFRENVAHVSLPGLALETSFLANEGMFCNIKPHAFKRAISNILGNSAKYATQAKLSTHLSAKTVIIDIEDNGKGISDSEKGSVFKPFYRSDKSRHLGDQPNVGLGLAITKEIIQGHEGSIALRDGKDLGGLLVRINLPIVGG